MAEAYEGKPKPVSAGMGVYTDKTTQENKKSLKEFVDVTGKKKP